MYSSEMFHCVTVHGSRRDKCLTPATNVMKTDITFPLRNVTLALLEKGNGFGRI